MNHAARTRQGNYTYLLIGLLTLLLAAPFVIEQQEAYARLVFHATLSATLLIGVWTLVRERRWFALGLILTLVSLALNSAAIVKDHPALIYCIIVVELLFFFLTLVIAFYDVVLEGPPDLNKIVGAVCIYLLVGIIWGFLFLLVGLAQPGAFSGVTSTAPEHKSAEMMYLSFITLTTLGYGDIAPATHLARVLAYLEAILGQFFLAILVAGLVGAHIAERHSR